uniref:Uncharacterized protein n=1 Tax=Panagrolaimus davidi TaxID=227884 RepID=A0A914Q3D4_9BILA
MAVILNDKKFIAYIHGESNLIKISAINVETQEIIPSLTFTFTDAKKFIENIPKLINSKFKSILICVVSTEKLGFKNNIELCKALKDKLEPLKIPYYFVNEQTLPASGMLSLNKITSKIDDSILIIHISINNIYVMHLKYTENGYKIIAEGIKIIDITGSAEENKEKCFANFNHKKILLMPAQTWIPIFKYLKNYLFKSKKVIVVNPTLTEFEVKGCIETDKWLQDKINIKCHIIQQNYRCLMITPNIAKPELKITADCHDSLPFEKSIIVPRSNLFFTVGLIFGIGNITDFG